MRRSSPTRHPFIEDPGNTDPIDRRQWCLRCNLPDNNRIHQLPETDDEVREHEARRVGER